jgi:glycosyltransferase involved in cell wall biosynthesis
MQSRAIDVVRVITRLNIGGPARQALLLPRPLSERGVSMHLVWGSSSRREGSFPVGGVSNTFVPALRREIDPPADQRAYRAISALLASRRPRIVHTHMAKAGAIGRLAARRRGIPAVHTFHGHVLEGYFSEPVNRAIVLAERGLARITDALVVVSPAVRDELLALGIGTPSKWHVIPLGLDLEPLRTSKVRRPAARAALGIPDVGPVVGIVGRLVPIKEHATFFRAAEIVARDHPSATFVVAGDGEDRARLEPVARRLLGERVVFLGWVLDLRVLYAALDVVVLTSRNEGTPVALIEAMAANRPIVATSVGGVADVVKDGRTGLLARPGDASAVAAAIRRIINEPTLARALARRGRERSARYGVERLADDLSALYASLARRR